MRTRTLSRAFAAVLRKHRKRKKVSQELLAERANISSKMVSLIEREQGNPSLDVAYALAQGLEMPLADLIREAEAALLDVTVASRKSSRI